jgi:hypothetical protein
MHRVMAYSLLKEHREGCGEPEFFGFRKVDTGVFCEKTISLILSYARDWGHRPDRGFFCLQEKRP